MDRQEIAVDMIAQAARMLGWNVVIPKGGEEDDVDWILLVSPEATKRIQTLLEGERLQ